MPTPHKAEQEQGDGDDKFKIWKLKFLAKLVNNMQL